MSCCCWRDTVKSPALTHTVLPLGETKTICAESHWSMLFCRLFQIKLRWHFSFCVKTYFSGTFFIWKKNPKHYQKARIVIYLWIQQQWPVKMFPWGNDVLLWRFTYVAWRQQWTIMESPWQQDIMVECNQGGSVCNNKKNILIILTLDLSKGEFVTLCREVQT